MNKWKDGPVKLLQKYLECDLPQMFKLYKDLKINSARFIENDKKCLRNNVCFRYDSKSLCERDMCPYGNVTRCSACGKLDVARANQKCKRKVSVSKVIRIYDIEKLKAIVENPRLDLKVILLYRDPRAIANSRAKIHPTWNLGENLKTYCTGMMHNFEVANEKWIKNRIKLIRYEDLALHPFQKAEELLTFSGLKFEKVVRNWISENTKPPDGAREEQWYEMHSQAFDPNNDHFSTNRDAKAAINSWRTRLNITTVLNIQNSCEKFMNFGNYKRVSNRNDLNNFNISLSA